jgi:ADP-dependent NAD(P)H-hydrate dehydratase / NAD(P)H-hydrate epimerase
MLAVLDAAAMRAADRYTIDELGVPGTVLMERAGTAVVAEIRRRFPEKKRIAILCGRGNNGGDGFVVARQLAALKPTVLLVGARTAVTGDARAQLEAYEKVGGAVHEVLDEAGWAQERERVLAAELLVDALLGTGLKEAPTGLVQRVISDVAVSAPRIPIVAVDIPSGLSSDQGEIPGAHLSAALTVTFAAPKHGHVLPPACDHVGELVVADIGIPIGRAADAAGLFLLERADAGRAYPPRRPCAHKGDFGHLLVLGGSLGKSGAAVLAGTAALRAGAGLVTVATAREVLSLVAAHRPELMTEPLPSTMEGALARLALERALELAGERDAVALGPGLGQTNETRAFVSEFVRRCPKPLLVDADGLNALAAGGIEAVKERSHATILTPHPGEMARLLGQATREVQADRVAAARTLAQKTGAVVVLKGQRTVIADPAGRVAINPTGNPGLAKAGSGDVLAGIGGALAARGLDAWQAAVAAVYLHGLAGDLARDRLGEESLLAGDVIEALPRAILALKEASSAKC